MRSAPCVRACVCACVRARLDLGMDGCTHTRRSCIHAYIHADLLTDPGEGLGYIIGTNGRLDQLHLLPVLQDRHLCDTWMHVA